jgi:hypothetical protein
MPGDFSANVDKEDIFKATIGNESLPKMTNSNGMRVVRFARPKNLTVKIQCSHIMTSINILGRLKMGKPTIKQTLWPLVHK